MLHCIQFLSLHYQLHYFCITLHCSCTGVALKSQNQKMPGVVWWFGGGGGVVVAVWYLLDSKTTPGNTTLLCPALDCCNIWNSSIL